ncbi:MAG: hypothetical protein GTN55_05340 [Gammaproteobacteria bacterium]|nr:hypothetical protein [Gammaproteobacteria bacterium]NIT05617.1 hypothetical protein [Gammaproteobacteria bacterium]
MLVVDRSRDANIASLSQLFYRFILAHEPTVTFYIGTEDGRELWLNLVGGYGTTP